MSTPMDWNIMTMGVDAARAPTFPISRRTPLMVANSLFLNHMARTFMIGM